MALENWFLTNPFGTGPRDLTVIYTGLTGGGILNLDGEPTYPLTTDGTVARFVIESETVVSLWQLVASTHVDDPTNGWKRPLDYEATENAKVWKRIQFYSAGGGGGGGITIVGEIPQGAINGLNKSYVTTSSFQPSSLEVYVNGLRMRDGPDYSITGVKTFQMVEALLTGDNLQVDYII
jgi:hypothetical protein